MGVGVNVKSKSQRKPIWCLQSIISCWHYIECHFLWNLFIVDANMHWFMDSMELTKFLKFYYTQYTGSFSWYDIPRIQKSSNLHVKWWSYDIWQLLLFESVWPITVITTIWSVWKGKKKYVKTFGFQCWIIVFLTFDTPVSINMYNDTSQICRFKPNRFL